MGSIPTGHTVYVFTLKLVHKASVKWINANVI